MLRKKNNNEELPRFLAYLRYALQGETSETSELGNV